MGISRKQALKEAIGKLPEAKRHIERIRAAPADLSARKWRSEALGLLKQIEEVLRHVGKKTAAEWQREIDAWRAELESQAEDAW